MGKIIEWQKNRYYETAHIDGKRFDYTEATFTYAMRLSDEAIEAIAQRTVELLRAEKPLGDLGG